MILMLVCNATKSFVKYFAMFRHIQCIFYGKKNKTNIVIGMFLQCY